MSGELILIVEYNEANKTLVRDVLQHSGYQTLEANSAVAGMDLARESRPDLFISDVWLPDIHGARILEQLRGDQKTCNIPCMAVTASAMANERATIIGAGFDAYLSKLFHIKELLNHVQRLLERRQRGEATS